MPSLPISFKEFNRHPMAAILYLCLAAIVGLFGYLQISNGNEKKLLKEQFVNCQAKNYTQDVEMQQLRSEVLKAVSLVNRLESKLETLKELGQIK